MATKHEEHSEAQRIKEVIHKLNAALEQCHKLLRDTEDSPRDATRDNDPPS